jgi:hypothetical protein
MTKELTDCWDRLGWADAHAGRLDEEIRAHLGDPHPYTPVVNGDQRNSDHVSGHIEMQINKPIPDRLTRHVGIILDDLRATLNYLTYQLALKDGIRNRDSVEFPIFNDPERYTRDNRVKKLSEKHRIAIADEQPYNGRNPNMWILHELSRAHRHRRIHPILAVLAGQEHQIAVLGGHGTIERQDVVQTGPFQDGDVVMTFEFQALGPYLQVEVKPRVLVDIVLDHPLTTETPCQAIVKGMGREVIDLVRRFEDFFA